MIKLKNMENNLRLSGDGRGRGQDGRGSGQDGSRTSLELAKIFFVSQFFLPLVCFCLFVFLSTVPGLLLHFEVLVPVGFYCSNYFHHWGSLGCWYSCVYCVKTDVCYWCSSLCVSSSSVSCSLPMWRFPRAETIGFNMTLSRSLRVILVKTVLFLVGKFNIFFILCLLQTALLTLP